LAEHGFLRALGNVTRRQAYHWLLRTKEMGPYVADDEGFERLRYTRSAGTVRGAWPRACDEALWNLAIGWGRR